MLEIHCIKMLEIHCIKMLEIKSRHWLEVGLTFLYDRKYKIQVRISHILFG